MSAITSGNPNAQARPSSGIYTALLIVALVFMVVTIVFLAQTTQKRFGYTMPMGDEFEAAKKAPANYVRTIEGDLSAIVDGQSGTQQD